MADVSVSMPNSIAAVPAPPKSMVRVTSDDEDDSFEILGHSLVDVDVDYPVDDANSTPVLSPIEEGRVQEMQNLPSLGITKIATADEEMELATAVNSIALSPLSSYEEVQKRVEELIMDNNKLKNTIEQNSLNMKMQYERIVVWQDEVHKVCQSYKDKCIEAKNHMDKLKESNAKLSSEVEKYKSIKELQDEEIMNLKDILRRRENDDGVSDVPQRYVADFDLKVAADKIKDVETSLQITELNNMKLAEENEKLKQKLVDGPELEEQLAAKQTDIEKLELELKVTKAQNAEQQQTLNEQLRHLRVELSMWEEKCGPKFIGDHARLQEHYGRLQKQLMLAQMEITKRDETIKTKNEELEEVRKQLEENLFNKDEIFALRSQLDVYKTDFDAEKSAKNSLRQEKEQLEEDLQNLQRRNQQLQEEIELTRNNYVVYPPAPASAPRPSESPRFTRYPCPICNSKFRSLKLVEEHVEHCLNTSI